MLIHYFLMGVPFMSCSLVVAHDCLHSGKHSCRVFCSAPLGLVHSYMHLLRHVSYAGSFLVPLRAGSTAALTGGTGFRISVVSAAAAAAAAVVVLVVDRKVARSTGALAAGREVQPEA